MRVLFWVPYPTEGASNRYRVEQYLPYLREAGVNYSLRPFWSKRAFRVLYKNGHWFTKCFYFILGTIYRFFDLLTISQYDLVFIHREAYPIGGAFLETLLVRLKKPFIFDFDDAIFLPTVSRPNNFIERYKKPDKITDIIKMSKCVIAGNHYLADFALRYNRSVYVIPTPIDTESYYPNKKDHRDEVIIGWIGSVTTSSFLNSMKNIFIQLSKRFHQVKFKIVGGDFCIVDLPSVINKTWSLEEEMDGLRTFDIGIMPMPDNEWTKGKCGFKAILYMSMGIPCVCSPVGVNKEIIVDGINGFLADTEDKWIEKFSLLIEDSKIRERLALAGRRTVEERYSVNVNAPKFLKIIEDVYNGRYK